MTISMTEGMEKMNQGQTPASANAELSEKERRRRIKAMAKGRTAGPVRGPQPQPVEETTPQKPKIASEEVQLKVFQGMINDAASAEEIKELLLAFSDYAQIEAIAPLLQELDNNKREMVRQAFREVFTEEQLKELDAFLGHSDDVEKEKEAQKDAALEPVQAGEQAGPVIEDAALAEDLTEADTAAPVTEPVQTEEPKQESALIPFLKKYVADQEALRQIAHEEATLRAKKPSPRRVRPFAGQEESIRPVKPTVEATPEMRELQEEIKKTEALAFAKWVDISFKYKKLTAKTLDELGALENLFNKVAGLKIRYQGAIQRAIDATESKVVMKKAVGGTARARAGQLSAMPDAQLGYRGHTIQEIQNYKKAQRQVEMAVRKGRELQGKERREALKTAWQRNQEKAEKGAQAAFFEAYGFASFLEHLDEKLADDAISQEEYEKKKAAVQKIKASSSPKEILDDEYAGGTFDDEEYGELKAYLESGKTQGKKYGSLEELEGAYADDKIGLDEFSQMKKEFTRPQGA